MISTKNDQFDLTRNHPAPILSDSLQKELTKVGGVNQFGEPNFRLVWGQNERKIAFGALHMKYIIGRAIRWEDKFDPKTNLHTKERIVEEIGLPRFILEEWMPPDFFGTPQVWENHRWNWIDGIREDNLGPYPERGRYVHYSTVETDEGEFRYPDQRELNLVAQAMWDRRNVTHNLEQEMKDEREAVERAEQKREDDLEQDLKDSINIHYNRLTEGSHRANKGGSGNRVFLNNPTE